MGCALVVAVAAGCATTAFAPAWFSDRDAMFPPGQYISATGEGSSVQEAQDNALSQISLFFDTTVTVSRDLVARYAEAWEGGLYDSAESRTITEKSDIQSASQFFCVQFTSAFRDGGTYYVAAFIDRDAAYKTFKENISVNSSVLRTLLPLAERHDNPFYSVPAATKGMAVANLTAQLIKNVRAVKNVAADDFSEAQRLVERMMAAKRGGAGSLAFGLVVTGDWNGTVQRTLSQLLEGEGFAVGASQDGGCVLVATVEPHRSQNAAGVFLACALTVTARDQDGRPVFSYTRTFDREGAPAQYEEVAWRKSFARIEEELRASFIREFNATLNGV